jgi:hypothetical protein
VAALLLGTGLSSAAAAVVIQQTTIYISALPKGCVMKTYTSSSGKVTIWKCGTLYYQPYNGRYMRVYIR